MSISSIEQERAKRDRLVQMAAVQAVSVDVAALPAQMPSLCGAPPGDWSPQASGLPPHCPVLPLGFDDASVYYLSARGTITQLKAMSGKGDIALLFAPASNYPVWAWPRWEGRKGATKTVNGNFDADEARKCLFHAAALTGPWDPLQSQRGRGAWIVDGGAVPTPHLLLHLGDRLLTPTGERPPGIYGGHVYPGKPHMPGPAGLELPAKDRLAGCRKIWQMLGTWNWSRGTLDQQLMMGWIVCALIGGALRWRPYIFVVGDKGKGKSYLLDVVQAVLGGQKNVLRSEDATEPGIAQSLGYDALPVILDEMENEADGSKAQSIIKMARRAASGSQRIRGGQDHKASAFVVRSCFLFAAINMPTMDVQDMSRMALLALKPLHKSASSAGARPDLSAAAAVGPLLLRQVLDWCGFGAGTMRFTALLEKFRLELMVSGAHDDRGADTFGFLLAGYWAALHVKMPSAAEVKLLCAGVYAPRLAEYEFIEAGWQRCWKHLLADQPRALERAMATSVGAILRLWRDDRTHQANGGGEASLNLYDARRALAKVGLGLKVDGQADESYESAQLFVPLSNPALSLIFDRTKWKASSRECPGAWTSALREGPENLIRPGRMRLARTQMRGTLITIAPLIGYDRMSKNYDADLDRDG